MFFTILGLGVPAVAVNLALHSGRWRENLTTFPMRAAVLEAVGGNPGITFSVLRERLHCAPGTLQHHVNLLEKERFLVSVQAGRRRRLFLAGTPTQPHTQMELLRSSRAWQLVRSVLERPGIVQKDIASGMDISRKVLRAYLDRLAEQGLVREVPAGRFRSYYPSEGLLGLVARMPPGVEAPEGLRLPPPPMTPQATTPAHKPLVRLQ